MKFSHKTNAQKKGNMPADGSSSMPWLPIVYNSKSIAWRSWTLTLVELVCYCSCVCVWRVGYGDCLEPIWATLTLWKFDTFLLDTSCLTQTFNTISNYRSSSVRLFDIRYTQVSINLPLEQIKPPWPHCMPSAGVACSDPKKTALTFRRKLTEVGSALCCFVSIF